MQTLTLPAPAKINLFLHILGQRSNGYHSLQTAFQFLQKNDQLTFSKRNDRQVIVHAPSIVGLERHNTIYRAAQFLKEAASCGGGADIHLEKNLPIGAGLGGGSSDAATTLWGLNLLWDTRLTQSELAELGLLVGADVPVFVYGHAAWAEGIGEKCQAIDLPERWCVVMIPPCTVSTVEIYTAAELTRNTAPITINEFISRGGHNDCEPVVRKRYPAVATALDWLNQFSAAKMTGTGGCVFALFDDEKEAAKVCQQIPAPYQGFVTKTLNKSPLHSYLETL